MQNLYSLSGKTSYNQISRSLDAERMGGIMIVLEFDTSLGTAADWKSLNPHLAASRLHGILR